MKAPEDLQIGHRRVGARHPVFVVAELSANHNRDFDRAVALVRTAKEAGADAIKLQTYTPDTLTIDCSNEYFRIGQGSSWEGRTLYDLYREAFTPWEWHRDLQRLARDLGMELFSTPFDASAVDFLEELEVPAYKVASFELVEVNLIRRIARTGKPIIMSTGLATAPEIEEALQAARAEGATEIALLKCTSSYPAPAADMHLRTIPHMREVFGVHVGLSDHTLRPEVPVAAVALGARIVEKHLTDSRAIPGPDSAFSLEPHEFKTMVEMIRVVESALGDIRLEPTPSERASRIFRRSLFVVKDVVAGEKLTTDNIASIRPGAGLHPRHLDQVLGRTFRHSADRGTPLSWELIEEGQESSAPSRGRG